MSFMQLAMLSSEALFVRVVEVGSLKKAAEELNIEPSTVSRKIAKLEARLNTKLFHRSTVRTIPTESGLAYYEGLRHLLNAQETLEAELFCNQTQIGGLLRIATTVDLGDYFIAPILTKMLKQHPQLRVEMLTGSNLADLPKYNIDVAIRIGKPANSDLYAKHLGTIPRVLVSSPAYLANTGVPKDIDDLKHHQFVFYSKEQTKMPIQFESGYTFEFSLAQGNVMANSLRSIQQFVLADLGINWGPRWLYEDAIASGELVEVLPQCPVKGFEINALYTMSQYLPRKVRWFLEALESELALVKS
ncbi:LysR family transcriptional regulator [Pseudoalteromonas xiamenensis]|nr:LysR family transcriptional regulator [Pseudoalteromonas xiamenensis]